MAIAARYTDEDAVKLALRAPSEAAAQSWTDGTYDELIGQVILEAEVTVDDICSSWAPFSGGTKEEERTFTADGSAVYGILSTDPYVAVPDSVERSGGQAVTAFSAYIAPKVGHSGRSLEGLWVEGNKYTMEAEWGHSEVPPGVHLAATRIAAKSFIAERTAMNQGIVETSTGPMYEPRFDPYVRRWLNRWMGAEVQ